MNKMQKAQADGIVVVFGPEGVCGQCIATKRALDSKGIPYRFVAVAEDDDATRDSLRALDLGTQFPIVWAPGFGYWTGFRPDRIDELAGGVA